MADPQYNFKGVDEYGQTLSRTPEPATRTTTPGQLGFDLNEMLGNTGAMGPPANTQGWLGQSLSPLPGMTSANPWDPYGSETGAQVIQRGLPMAGSMIGSSMGPVGAGAGAAVGEWTGQKLTGQTPSPGQVIGAGLLGFGGAVAGRVLSGASRIAETNIRSSPTAQALGVRAPYATAESDDMVPLTGLKSTVQDLLAKWNRIIPSDVKPNPAQGGRLVNELDELNTILSDPNRTLSEAATIRRLLGMFVEGNKGLPEARALYGAYMGDLRQAAAAGSTDAQAYLHDLANDKVVRSLFPENMLERMLLYGSAGMAGMGNPGVALPAAGVLGMRAFQATPRSVMDPLGAALATQLNPYRRRSP